ncbi:MAG: aminoacyl-histidine dipeptidase [Lachnospiraceae bacterium]|nr:aminoacyl-histidine dipeptidase [Lachnospiraceae bacterium]
MGVLSNLEPKKVFHYFEEICKIPHGSYNTKQLSDYLVNFAKERGLTSYQDEANNVIIIKEGTTGYESAPAVILQGHIDMVCQKAPDSTHDFLTDGLDLDIDGDLVLAKGTTLGGDNGIAVAYCLALLDSDDIPHPKLEVLLTSDEEVGLLGAVAADLSMLESKMLINLDSEEEGEFLTSCAGGGRANMFLPVDRVEKEGIAYEVAIEDLTGGHSGIEITKERGNANKLMGRLLMEARKEAEFYLAELEGGQADNAIPRSCSAVVLVDEADQVAFENAVAKMGVIFKNEQKTADPDLNVVCTNLGYKELETIDRSSLTQALMVLNMLPNGIQAWSVELEDLVETSLNLGVMKLDRDELRLSSSVRSSVGSKKAYLFNQLKMLIEYAGGTMKIHGEYPAWEYKAESHIRNVFVDTYREITGKEPEIKAIHAGLECGIFCDKIEGIDCISLGPNMSGVHTTEERLSISSTERTWKLLVEVLKRLK